MKNRASIKVLISLLVMIGLNRHLPAQEKQMLYAKDVQSIESTVSAVLETISGEKGEKRDWVRFRHLFVPTAQLNAVFHRADSSYLRVNTLDVFIEKAGTWYEDNGFYEYAYKNKIDRFGNIAHVFQSYGAKLEGGEEMERGINSFQLVYDQGRWWVVNLIWDSETEQNQIPNEYLE